MKNLLTTPFLMLSFTVFAQLDFTDLEPIYEGDGNNNINFKYALSYDLNNDNISDFLHIQNHDLYVQYGDGETFGSEELLYSHTATLYNFSNAVDLNQDGFLDFTITAQDDKVIIFLGGTEGLTQTILNEPAYNSLLNDFDKDGTNDIIYATLFDIYYLPGNNDGTFNSAVPITENVSEIGSIFRFSIADIDGDTDNDLFVLDLDNRKLHVVINTDLNFSASNSIEISGAFFSNGDFNQDGKIDAVAVNSNNELAVFLNQPDGFTSSYTYNTFNLRDILVIDYDEDGRDDILASNRMTDLTVLTSKGDGTFNDPEHVITGMPRFANHSLVDYNNDGNKDIVAMGTVSNQVILVPLTPQVQVNDQFDYLSLRSDPGSTFSTQVGDLDLDGFDDLVIFSENGAVIIHYGIENGFESSFMQHTSNVFTEGGFLQDINADGLLDLIVYYRSADNGTIGTEILLNESERTFSEPTDFKSVFGIFKGIFDDYDKDDVNNFIVSTLSNEIVFLTANQNNSDEYFSGSPSIISLSDFIHDFELADINNDGWKDVLVTVLNSTNIEVYLSDQMGGFDSPFLIALESGQSATAVTAADLDGDDIVEIIVSGSQKAAIYDRESLMDDFTLTTSFNVNSNFGTEYIWIEDFDGDSDLDIFFNDFDNLQYTFAINTDEGWETESDLLEPFGQNTILLSDINGDNLLDMIRTKIIPGSIQLTLNSTVYEPTNSNTEIVSITQENSFTSNIVLSEAEHDGRIVIVKAGSAVDGSPVDGIFYSQNSTFGTGSEIGDGNYVVYAGNENEISVQGLTNQSNYHVAVFEYNINGSKNSIINYKTDVSVPGEFSIVLGLDDEDLALYPNPTSDFLRLKNLERFDSIKLMDINGKSIPMKITTQGIDVSQLIKGVYVLKIGSKGESKSLKFIKN